MHIYMMNKCNINNIQAAREDRCSEAMCPLGLTSRSNESAE